MRKNFISLGVVALSAFMSVSATVYAQDFAPYGTAKVDMHTKARGINTVFDVNARSTDPDTLIASLNAVNGVSINVMKETGGKVIFVFHGKEQIAFANKNQTQYSGVMTKLSELKNQGVEFRFCNNAMKGNGLVPADMNGLVTVVPAGYPELAYLQSQGYQYMFFSY